MTLLRRRVLSLAQRITFCLTLCLLTAAAHGAMFTGLGTLPGNSREDLLSIAAAISDDGTTVVGRSGDEGFRWTLEAGMEWLGHFDGGAVLGQDVSADGSVIIGETALRDLPVRRTESTGWEVIDPYFADLADGGNVRSVSADGSVIVGDATRKGLNFLQAYRWTEETGVIFLEPNADTHTQSFTFSVTPDGSVVVGAWERFTINDPNVLAFRWTEATGMRFLGTPPFDNGHGDTHAWATDVSADGRVIVGHLNASSTAFIWSEDLGYAELRHPQNQTIDFPAVSGDGSIVVADDFYWDAEHGARTLRDVLINDYDLEPYLRGWRLNGVDITPDGRAIAGWGQNPFGQLEAWVAYLDDTVNPNPPPEIGIATTPVDSVDLSTDGELQAFVAGGVTYSHEELIEPTLTGFVGHSGSTNTFVTQTGDVLPESGARAELLTDLRLDTGVINPATDPQAATLLFAEPLVNGPGPDLIVFEVASTLPFQVAVDETVGVVLSPRGYDVARVDIATWSMIDGAPTGIDDLENGSFVHNRDISDTVVFGVAIDLDELGVGPLDEVTTLHFGSFRAERAFDPVLIMGIDSVPDEPTLDFNQDGNVDGDDVDALVAEIIARTNEPLFDVSRDGLIDHADLTEWLSHAATENGFAEPYLLGDANLDGTVNAADLNKLGQSWLASPNAWQWGDFTADGVVDASDLDELAQNWLMSIPAAASLESVPEPSGMSLELMFVFLVAVTPFRATG